MPVIAPKPALTPLSRPSVARTSSEDNAHPESQRSRGLASDVPSPRVPVQAEAPPWDIGRVLAVAACQETVFDARRRREPPRRHEDDEDVAAEPRPRDLVTISFARERRRRPRAKTALRPCGRFKSVPIQVTMLDALLGLCEKSI